MQSEQFYKFGFSNFVQNLARRMMNLTCLINLSFFLVLLWFCFRQNEQV
jgi:hypothetical protein